MAAHGDQAKLATTHIEHYPTNAYFCLFYLFFQQMFVECLLYDGHNSRFWLDSWVAVGRYGPFHLCTCVNYYLTRITSRENLLECIDLFLRMFVF